MAKRPDGYHNIETVFYPLPIFDVLELMEATETRLTLLGLTIPGSISDNIILKAYNLLKKDFSSLPPVHFYLLKNIPVGSGLGAGSANGAFALIGLNKKFNLNLSPNQLLNYALQLGSDCPFFIVNQPCFAKSRGEIFEPIHADLRDYKMVLVNPGIHISTPWAFSQLKPEIPPQPLPYYISKPITEWKDFITNDFETPVFGAYPEIAAIKKTLYATGAVFALMSGSGSTVYGLFEKNNPLQLPFPESYFVKHLDSIIEYPG